MNDSLNKQKATKDINIINYIYDEQFINLINSLSTFIKEYFQNFKKHISSLKIENDIINEQTTYAKSALNDILLYLVQTRSKSSNNIHEKFIREKCDAALEKMNKINNAKENLTQQSKASEIIFMSFYDNAKELFKQMKIARNQKIDEINAKINFDEYIEKKRDQTTSSITSKSPSDKNNFEGSNSNCKGNSTVGVQMHTTMKITNSLNQSHDESSKKNEIMEFTMIKGKYNDLLKENQNLKNMINKHKSKEVNTLMNSASSNSNTMNNSLTGKNIIANVKESFGGINQHKTRSFSKGNQGNSYITCNTTGNEEHSLGKVSLIINNATITTNTMSNTINKGSGTLHLHKYSTLMSKVNNKGAHAPRIKRNYSIDNKKSSQKQSINDQRQHHKNNEPIDTANNNTNTNTYPVNLSFVNNSNSKSLNNSNSTNNAICPNSANTNGNSLNNSFSTQSNLATLVIAFIHQMKALQESISAKSENIKEMKISFELKKKELIKLSENILGTTAGSMINTTMTSLNNTPRSCTNNKKQTLPPSSNTNTINTNTIPNNKTDLEFNQMKLTIQELEKKVKNEKSISSLYEEKLNSEKTQNKELNDMVSQLNEQISNIKTQEKESNEALIKDIQSNKETIDHLENEINIINQSCEELQKINDECKAQIEALTLTNQTIIDENSSYTNQIAKLKLSITECNHNIITISNTNESIISEKDVMIKKLTNTIKDYQLEKDQLNKEIQEHLDTNNKLKSLKEKEKDKENNDSNEIIQDLNQTITKYQQDMTQSKQENRDLMNKISKIKNEYCQYDEEKRAAEKLLNDLNETTATNIKILQQQNALITVNNNTESTIKSTEIYSRNLNLLSNDIAYSSELYALVMKCNQLMLKMTKDLEDKMNSNTYAHDHMIIVQQNETLKKDIMKIQEEMERMKYLYSKESISNRNNNPNKTLSNINEQNSNFIDDDLSNVSEIFLEDKIKEKSNRNDKEIIKSKTQPIFKENNLINPTQAIMPIEELITTMKIAFERLINAIQIKGTMKEDIMTIFKLLNYNENDIQHLLDKKDKDRESDIY